MSTYVFRAMDLAGVKAKGEVEADSKQAVSDQLKQRGLVVLEIADKHASREINMEFLQRVKLQDLAIMSRQLATMVSSGMSILRALYVLEEQTESKKLSATLVDVRKDVEAGLPLSDAFARHPKVFNSLFVAMTRAGETGGLLESALLEVADQMEKEASLRRMIRSAMIYPILVITFAFGVMIALVAFLVPVFENVFKQFGGDLPPITKVSVGLSHFVTSYGYLIPIIVPIAILVFVRWKRTKSGQAQWDRFKLRLPMKMGEIVQKVAIARWSRTLSSLVSAGVPLIQALEITGKTAGNHEVEVAMNEVIDTVKRGGQISDPLKDAKVFPAMVTHMVGVGEETGALDSMLKKIADFYDDQVAAAVKALTAIMEPVMIILVGGIVGFIVISMYLPLFTVYNNIR